MGTYGLIIYKERLNTKIELVVFQSRLIIPRSSQSVQYSARTFSVTLRTRCITLHRALVRGGGHGTSHTRFLSKLEVTCYFCIL